MRSRRSITSSLLLVVMVAGCGGANTVETTLTPPPTDVVATSAAPSPTAPPTAPPTSSEPATTALATTVEPTTTSAGTGSSTSLGPTTTRQVITLPPGVTEADRLAVEAAAIAWWEEFYRQLLALPDFDPQAILKRAVPGRPAGPELVAAMELRKVNRFSFEPGLVHQTVLLDTRFLSADLVEIQVCLADDGAFVQDGSGIRELEGLGRVFYLAVLRRVGTDWKVDDFGSFRPTEDGKACQ